MESETLLALALTWNPRGELTRFERSLPLLWELYDRIIISFPEFADASILELFMGGIYSTDHRMRFVLNHDWSAGRYMALKESLGSPATHIQYVDMDRLLRWIETYPDEWRNIISVSHKFDCLIIGRTERAYDTHPKALRQTEEISNEVVSFIVGHELDVSAGIKCFSRNAAQYIIDHSSPRRAFGTDGEWPIILYRAGYSINYIAVDGLSWESADRYQNNVATPEEQERAASKYDEDPDNWAYRVQVAAEIIHTALNSYKRELD